MDTNEAPEDFVSRSIIARKTIRFWDRFLAWLFSHSARSYLKGKRVENICIPFPEYTEFYKKYSRFGTVRGIICAVTEFEEDKEICRKMLETMDSKYDDVYLKELVCADFYGKAISYRNLKEGDSFPFYSARKKLPITFTLDTVIPLWNDICAFGFISSNDEALLLFRGTDISFLSTAGRASMLSDLDPEGPGLALFENAKEALSSWLQVQKGNGKETRVIGHSLGGSLACYTLLFLPHLLSKTAASFATNYPGVNETLLKKWDGLDPKPKFCGIVTEGDAVSKFGFLLNETLLFTAERKLPLMQSHELLFGAEPNFTLYQINVIDENTTKSRELISKFHRGTSSILYQMGLKHILPSKKEEE